MGGENKQIGWDNRNPAAKLHILLISSTHLLIARVLEHQTRLYALPAIQEGSSNDQLIDQAIVETEKVDCDQEEHLGHDVWAAVRVVNGHFRAVRYQTEDNRVTTGGGDAQDKCLYVIAERQENVYDQ